MHHALGPLTRSPLLACIAGGMSRMHQLKALCALQVMVAGCLYHQPPISSLSGDYRRSPDQLRNATDELAPIGTGICTAKA